MRTAWRKDITVIGILKIAYKLLVNDKGKFAALLTGITFSVFFSSAIAYLRRLKSSNTLLYEVAVRNLPPEPPEPLPGGSVCSSVSAGRPSSSHRETVLRSWKKATIPGGIGSQNAMTR